MRVLATHRRNAAAARRALVALASLGLVAVAAYLPTRGALRTVFAGTALLGYAVTMGKVLFRLLAQTRLISSTPQS